MVFLWPVFTEFTDDNFTDDEFTEKVNEKEEIQNGYGKFFKFLNDKFFVTPEYLLIYKDSNTH